MGIGPQKFFGIETRTPGVYSKSRFPQSPGGNGAPSNIVVVLGSANGGIPYNASDVTEEERLNRFSTVSELLDVLRGGAGYYMGEFYLTPHRDPNFATPQNVIFVRVDPASRATKKIRNSGDTADIIALKSTRFGTLANQLSFQLQAGTNIGHKITAKFQGTTVALKDDVGYTYFNIQYVGAGTAATMTTNATTLATTVTGGPGGENLSLAFADFPTVGQLVSYIDDLAGYTCTLAGQSDALSATMDAVTAVDIRTTVYGTKAIVQAVIDFFNNETQGEFIAALETGASRTTLQNNASFVFMASGSNGTATNSDWIAALAMLEKFDVNHILPATGDATIHQLVVSHCEQMSQITKKKYRSCGVGASSATTTRAGRQTEMRALNSSRAEYHCTPFYRPDVFQNNITAEWAPFYGAALTAGIRFGNFITISATFKTLNVVGLKEKYTDTEIEQYLSTGATLFKREERGTVVVHNLTTYQGDNLILNLPSALRTVDFITADIQRKVQARIAQMDRAATGMMIAEMQNWIVTNLLPSYEVAQLLTKDPNDGTPAFYGVQFQIVGDRFDLKFSATIPVPLHFVFITQDFYVVGANVVQAAA